jgi:hypothetical protein
LSELAGFNESTTQRDGGTGSYTGLYIRGQHTYLEFMKASNDPIRSIGRAPAGDLSFCMWVDDRLKLPLVRDRLAARTHTDPKISMSKLFIGGRDSAWFDKVSATDSGDTSIAARTYVMSLYPDYLRQRYPDLKAGKMAPRVINESVNTFLIDCFTTSRDLRWLSAPGKRIYR